MSTDFPFYEDEAGHPPAAGQETLAQELERTTDPNRIVTSVPKERFRLGYVDVACLVINRMIGTGIFESPQSVIKATKSTGVTLLFWFFGIFYCLSGAHVYMEYGLNVPRYVVDGVEQGVPRSGGDLNYLQYVFNCIYVQKDTVLLMGCLFGITFICIGNMAGNCIICALRIMQAANPDRGENDFAPGTIRGLAIAIAIFACFVHAVSRRGGILLNNILAFIKVGILLVIIGTACAVAGGGVHSKDGSEVPNVISPNTSTKTAFKDASDNPNEYAHAFLSIIFAFGGFDQPNYVLGEIQRPRRTYPRATFFGVTTVSLLYMAVNLCYMVVVPALDQATGQGSVAQQFFEKTFGAVGNAYVARRTFNAFLAISSFGNIVVMTYTAARMKQEIAKQGFIPFPKFFASNTDFSIGRFFKWLEKRGIRSRFLVPDQHSEETPVGALTLHFLSSLVLIFATYNLPPKDAYSLLAGQIAYLTTAWFGFFLALGILILRFRRPPQTEPVQTPLHHKVPDQRAVKSSWTKMTKRSVNPVVSIICAVLFLIGNGYPIITDWIPPSDPDIGAVRWFVTPLLAWCLLGFGALWFLGFLSIATYRKRVGKQELIYERRPEFEEEETRKPKDDEAGASAKSPGLIMVHETVYISWRGTEMHELEQIAEDEADRAYNPGVRPMGMNDLEGTDFDVAHQPPVAYMGR